MASLKFDDDFSNTNFKPSYDIQLPSVGNDKFTFELKTEEKKPELFGSIDPLKTTTKQNDYNPFLSDIPRTKSPYGLNGENRQVKCPHCLKSFNL